MKSSHTVRSSAMWMAAVILLVLQGCGILPATQFEPTAEVPAATQPIPLANTAVADTDVPTQQLQPSDTPVVPTEVAEVLPDSQVRRLSPAVFAGNNQPLPEITTDRAINLDAGGLVTTGPQGEAEVLIQGCLKLFVFQDVTLQRSACRREDAASGLAVCSAGGMTGVLNQCASQIDIQTPGSTTSTSGTWFAVIYLPEDHLSIVQVYEGTVNVSAAINPQTGQWTRGAQLTEGNLWFTAPGDEPPVINGITGREAQPMEVWQALRPELIQRYPNLDNWMQAAEQRATEENLVFPDYLAPTPGHIDAIFTGPIWKDDRVQRAVIIGVDWNNLVLQNWSEFNVTPRILTPTTEIADARTVKVNQDEAIKLLTEADYWGSSLETLYLVSRDTDFAAQQFAFSLESALNDLKIPTQVTLVSDESFNFIRNNTDPASVPSYILLETSGDAFNQ